MLVIRMQRTGRKGHAMFRVVVQDSRQAPTSGKVVARLGSHDPHAKTTVLDKEKAVFYLEHGAQPSDRAVRLLKSEGVKLPGWVKEPTQKQRAVRNPDKRRSTAPEKPAEEAAEAPAAETTETTAEETAEAPAEDAAPAEAPAEEAASEEPEDEKAAEEAAPAESEEEAAKPEETGEPASSDGVEDAEKDEA